MKNESDWRPTKYVESDGSWHASRNPREVAVSSRLASDLTVRAHQVYSTQYFKGQLLDLGCGKAPLYGLYRPHVESCILADWESTTHANSHIDVFCDITKSLPFKNEEFDTILSSDVLEHIPTPDLLWMEMARILRPGGCIILNTPFFYPLHEEPYDYHRYTKYALLRFARENKLEILCLKAIGGGIASFCVLAGKLLVAVPHLGVPVSSMVQQIGKWLESRPRSQTKDTVFPLGYLIIARKSMDGQK